MIRRVISRSLIYALLLASLAVAALFAAAASERGSRWLIETVAAALPSLSVGAVRGTLLDRIEFDTLELDVPPHHLAVEHLTLDWRPSALRRAELAVSELSADGILYRGPAPSDDEQATPAAPPEIPLPLKIEIESLELRRITIARGDSVQTLERIALTATGDQNRIRIDHLAITSDTAAATLTGEASLPYLARLQADVTWQFDTETYGPLSGHGHAEGDLQNLRVQHSLTTPFDVDSRGTVDLSGPTVRFDLEGAWRALQWPLTGEAQIRSEKGRYRLSGTPEAYRIQLSGGLTGREFPAGQVEFEGRGTPSLLNIEKLELAGFKGALEATGAIGWEADIDIDLRLRGNGLDFTALVPQWPARLDDLDAHVAARLIDADRHIALEIQRLKGNLRGYPLAASGAVVADGMQLSANRFRIDSGRNRLRLDGTLDRTLALDFSLDAPELAAFHPALSGSLKGNGSLRGRRERPKLTAALVGRKLKFRDDSAGTLNLDLQFDAAPGGKISGSLSAAGVSAAGQRIDELALIARGTTEKQRILLDLDGSPGRLSAILSGGYRNARWTGRIGALEIDSKILGPWRLGRPAALRLMKLDSAPEVALEELCLGQNDARLCLAGDWARDVGFAMEGRIADLPLSLARPYLPDNSTIRGAAFGWFKAAQRGSELTADARISLTPGRIEVHHEKTKPLGLSFSDAKAHISLANGTVEMAYSMQFDGVGHSTGRLTSGPDGELGGRLRAEFDNLEALVLLVPALEKPVGHLSADLSLGGSSEQPRIDAVVALKAGRADLPDLGLNLRDIHLNVRNLDDRTLAIVGGVRSGDGTLEIEGTLVPAPDRGWPLELAIRGDHVQAVRLPEARILVSPDLKLTAAKGRTRITGTILVPEGKIELKELPPSAVTVSEDEIIVGEEITEDQASRAPSRIGARIEIRLGDAVQFEGYGLRADLQGRLALISREGRTSGQGEVDLKNGRYRAYGQDLTIERGRILFAGPVDNPTLDVKATRTSKTDQVKAVLSLSGPLKSPETRIYSEPPLSETEALAYLLTGHPLNRANKAQSSMLAQAALSYGLEYTQPIIQRFGIDEMQVETNGSLEETSIMLGKYLTPDLYVGYITDLFSSTPAVAVRYRLTKHLSAETRAGTSQSLDLRYSIEHD